MRFIESYLVRRIQELVMQVLVCHFRLTPLRYSTLEDSNVHLTPLRNLGGFKYASHHKAPTMRRPSANNSTDPVGRKDRISPTPRLAVSLALPFCPQWLP